MRFRQDRRLLFVLLLLVLLWSPACQFHYRTRDRSNYEGPGKPLKLLNRGISASKQSIGLRGRTAAQQFRDHSIHIVNCRESSLPIEMRRSPREVGWSFKKTRLIGESV
jgi:hypothetical protein